MWVEPGTGSFGGQRLGLPALPAPAGSQRPPRRGRRSPVRGAEPGGSPAAALPTRSGPASCLLAVPRCSERAALRLGLHSRAGVEARQVNPGKLSPSQIPHFSLGTQQVWGIRMAAPSQQGQKILKFPLLQAHTPPLGSSVRIPSKLPGLKTCLYSYRPLIAQCLNLPICTTRITQRVSHKGIMRMQ